MPVDFFFTFNRKIADRVLVPFFVRTPLLPNHITGLSLLAGTGAALSMAQGSRAGLLGGAFLLQLSFILDNCDGAVARLKDKRSRFGMWFDFAADLVVDWALWTGMAFGAVARGADLSVWGWWAAAVVGSTINFWRVIQARVSGQTGKEEPLFKNPALRALHLLGHDGDPSIFVWLLAFFGEPHSILVLGALYIHILWAGGILLYSIEKK